MEAMTPSGDVQQGTAGDAASTIVDDADGCVVVGGSAEKRAREAATCGGCSLAAALFQCLYEYSSERDSVAVRSRLGLRNG